MKKIDIHTHFLPKNTPKFKDRFGYGGFSCLEHTGPCKGKLIKDDGTFIRNVEDNLWDAQARLRECDQHGVAVQVLSCVPMFFSNWAKPKDTLEICKFYNDAIAEMVTGSPKRFVGLGQVPMQDPKLAAEELTRCMKTLGFPGIQIGSHVESPDLNIHWNLSDRALDPFFKVANDLGASIFIHPWDMMGQNQMKDYWLPWLVGMPAEASLAICSLIFGGVLERYPRIKFAVAHGGGSFPGTFGRIEQGYLARPDLVAKDHKAPPRESLGKFWVDSLIHDPAMLRLMIDLYGADKIALGTDYPFPLGEPLPGEVIEKAGLPKDVKRKLEWSNALNWLSLNETDFL